MAGRMLLALGLVLLGGGLDEPGLVLVGAVTLFAVAVMDLWSRYGLRALDFSRDLGSARAVWGDIVEIRLRVWNHKPLPLPRLISDDYIDDGLAIVERPLLRSEVAGQGLLRNGWSLLWYERVVRHLHLRAERRGVFHLGPVQLEVADLFGRDVGRETRDLPGTFTVLPRTVPARPELLAHAPLGDRRARSSLFHDPVLFAGVRPYQPGDTARQRHWRATARLGRPVTKRFEPSHERQVVIALDVQTSDGPHWLPVYDEERLEALGVAAASLARAALAAGDACGFAAAYRTGSPRWLVYLPPRSGAAQLPHIAESLARMGPFVTAPFEQLLAALPQRVPAGATLVTVSARSPRGYLGALRRLHASGFEIHHVALGPAGPAAARALRARGIAAAAADLAPDWRTADGLVRVG
ncbi:MAG: DUF58 domain-containing protein [Candidatus Limnocylindrales bacterium]